MRLLILLFTTVVAVYAAFHEDITEDERLHYFGTRDVRSVFPSVPDYHFTTPTRLGEADRRRRRSSVLGADIQQYVINAFDENIQVLLKLNKDLISPGCLVHHISNNGTKLVYPCNSSEVGCYYTGHVRNRSDSWVAASVCQGFDGMVHLPESTLLVTPVKAEHAARSRRETSLTNAHIVYRYTRQSGSCSTAEQGLEDPGKVYRRKRSAARRYVETTIVVDPSMYRFHGQETEKMVKTLLNVAAERFLDSSLPTKAYFSLVKLMILEEDQPGLTLVPDATTTLKSFCDWQYNWNPVDDKNPEHADYVALLTRLDLTYNGDTSNTGYAYTAGICTAKSKCSINEDLGLGTGLVLAHESGHALGMNHDGSGNSCTGNRYIMAANAASGPSSVKWSSCSGDALKKYLGSSKSSCLNDEPAAQALNLYGISTKPGTIYSGNDQCKLVYGETASLCEDMHSADQDVCGSIFCQPSPGRECIRHSATRMDGTECGSRKWCIGGSCVDMGSGSPGPINGGWSDWETGFAPCSRTCGGGVKVKRRTCNNPEPRYGGDPCVGSDAQAEICNIQPCLKSELQFLEEQCAATDSKSLNGKLYHWTPNFYEVGDRSCKLYCMQDGTAMFWSRGMNIDGSECRLQEQGLVNKCVGGKCKPFGCDGHADSGMKFDACAVCGGTGNTCTRKSGSYKEGQKEVFTTFVTIPKGSTGIRVTQKNQYCYLSVAVNGHRMFNDGSPPRSGSYTYGGVWVHYNSFPERINIVGPLPVDIQVQVYRKYGRDKLNVDPDIEYEYHIPQGGTETYLWKTQAGRCSKQCGTGSQTPVITCMKQGAGTVAEKFCNIFNKPQEQVQKCNTQPCPPRWRSSDWSACSKSCGGGSKQRTVECVQENNNVEKVLSESSCRGQAKPSRTVQCNTGQCPGTWRAGQWSSCSESCGRGIKTRTVKCYSSGSSNTPVPNEECVASQKPALQDYCLVKPCRTDITGAACKDSVSDCFSYGEKEGVCNGNYRSWARDKCKKSCGICVEDPSDYDPNCKDVQDNCDSYAQGFCTDSQYSAWAKGNCKKFCGLCGPTQVTTTAAPTDPNCQDTADCAAYGQDVCSEYEAWAKTNCKKFCKLCSANPAGTSSTLQGCVDTADCSALGNSVCQQTAFASEHCRKSCGLCGGCEDQEDNCAAYGSDMCKSYRPWASAHCQNFCGLCNNRRKRQAEEKEPPLKDAVPVLQELPAEDSLPPYEKSDVISAQLPDVPVERICNTVRTSRTGSIDIFGKVLPGETCIQTIALPLDSRVLLKFEQMNIDCDQGDVLRIVNGDASRKIQVCSSILDDTWLSAGSVVVLEFTQGQLGHGYSFNYKAFPNNKTVSACSRLLTAAVGHVSSQATPSSRQGMDGEICEIYITVTPGKQIQLNFDYFGMPPQTAEQNECDGLQIEDLEGGEVDQFCGTLAPFVWESQGARVKLTFRQQVGDNRFQASYTVQDL